MSTASSFSTILPSTSKYSSIASSYAKNHPQALKEISRRLKKSPRDAELLLWKAAVLLETGDLAGTRGCVGEIGWKGVGNVDESAELVERVWAVLGRCDGAEGAGGRVGAGKEVLAGWKGVVEGSKGVDKQTVTTAMAEAAIRWEYWEDAQMAFLHLKKQYPKNRHYFYTYAIVSVLLFETLLQIDPKKAGIIQMMTFRILDDAVKKTTPDPDEGSLPSIASLQELRVIVQLYPRLSHDKELVQVLKDHEVLKYSSKMVSYDLDFGKALLQAMTRLSMWSEIGTICVDVVSKSLKTDDDPCRPWTSDWEFWEFWIGAAKESPELRDQLYNSIDKTFSGSDLPSDFCRLKCMVSMFAESRLRHRGNIDSLVEAYAQRFIKVRCFFGDLNCITPFIAEENLSKLRTVAKAAVEEGHLTAQTNALKLEYQHISSSSSSKEEKLPELVSEALRIASGGSLESANDALMVAAMSEVHLYRLRASENVDAEFDLIRAGLIMDFLVKRIPSFRPALLYAIRIALQLGLGSIALNHYPDLEIKEVMNDTLSHVLYTRIASVHPHPIEQSTEKYISKLQVPMKGLQGAQAYLSRSVAKTSQAMTTNLDSNRFDSFLGFLELKQQMERGMTNESWNIEMARISQLRDDPSIMPLDTKLLEGKIERLVDNRDYRTFPGFEFPGQPPFESYTRSWQPPRKDWLLQFNKIIHLRQVINNPNPSESDIARLSQDVPIPADSEATLTPNEKSILEGYTLLRHAVHASLIPTSSPSTKALTQNLQALIDWIPGQPSTLKSDKEQPIFPSWTTLEHAHLILAFLQTTTRFCASALAPPKHRAKTLQPHQALFSNLKKAASKKVDEVQGDAVEWRKRISGKEVKETLLKEVGKGEIGEALGGLMGWEDWVEGRVGEYLGSGVDALGGVVGVKV
ncbi:hypothetical protein K402DRAFT_455727 [Aulographum hederae CBS 113979]|uniref:Cytoskeleton organization protein n=1 Tax=Aulographum hederae CBS 113979 TaxID=1176131 RepID=A0A6G1GUX4_9PEZI|nr:hypothetical protein K402DRAFT_455727 [Aulographum hederae CBS 113979]